MHPSITCTHPAPACTPCLHPLPTAAESSILCSKSARAALYFSTARRSASPAFFDLSSACGDPAVAIRAGDEDKGTTRTFPELQGGSDLVDLLLAGALLAQPLVLLALAVVALLGFGQQLGHPM